MLAAEAEVAADVVERLRGLGFGTPLRVHVSPRLTTGMVRAAKLRAARLRRTTREEAESGGLHFETDEEGQWSLTPWQIADAMAAAMKSSLPMGAHLLELGAGCGGNTVAFAKAGFRVTAVERDLDRSALLKRNLARARIGPDCVNVVTGDAARALGSPHDAVFVDPPWFASPGEPLSKTRVVASDLPLLAIAQALPAKVFAKLPPAFAVETLGEGWDADGIFGARDRDRHVVKLVFARRTAR